MDVTFEVAFGSDGPLTPRLSNDDIPQSPTDEAHPAIVSLDILEVVALFSSQETRATMMLVCRIWNDATLPLLWNKMESLLPILKLAGVMFYDNNYGWSYTRTPSNEGRSRFMLYASRVAALTHKDNKIFSKRNSVISPAVLQGDLEALRLAKGAETLFPNLTSLHLEVSSQITSMQAHSLITPSVECLVVCATDDLSLFAATGMLSRLARVSRLQSLYLILLPEHLCDATSFEAIENLLYLQPNLHTFALYCSRLPPISLWAALGTHQSLRVLYVAVRASFAEGKVADAIESLCNPSSEISEIVLFLGDWPFEIPFEQFHPLLRLRNLGALSLVNVSPRSFTERDISSMAKSWPSLWKLCFWMENDEVQLPGIPLHLIPSLAASFPKLRSLAIHTRVTVDSVIPEAKYMASRLRHLAFGSRFLQSSRVREVAEYLAITCRFDIQMTQSPHPFIAPYLRLDFESGLSDAWKEAVDLVKMVHRVMKASERIQKRKNAVFA